MEVWDWAPMLGMRIRLDPERHVKQPQAAAILAHQTVGILESKFMLYKDEDVER